MPETDVPAAAQYPPSEANYRDAARLGSPGGIRRATVAVTKVIGLALVVVTVIVVLANVASH